MQGNSESSSMENALYNFLKKSQEDHEKQKIEIKAEHDKVIHSSKILQEAIESFNKNIKLESNGTEIS
jgi:hypothetical protein